MATPRPVLGLCVFALALVSTVGATYLESWMGQEPAVASRTLQQITVPASHDSGSWEITDTLIGENAFVRDIVKIADKFGLPVGKIIADWARSQDMAAYDQLMAGVRYLDIRACWWASQWRAHHGPILAGPFIYDILQDVRRFIESHPTEIVLMGINHFSDDGVPAPTSAAYILLNSTINELLGRYLYPAERQFKDTIGVMRKNNWRVVIGMGGGFPIANSPMYFPSNWTVHRGHLPGAGGTDKLDLLEAECSLETYEWQAAGRGTGGQFPGQLYFWNFALTPNGDTIARGLAVVAWLRYWNYDALGRRIRCSSWRRLRTRPSRPSSRRRPTTARTRVPSSATSSAPITSTPGT
eukprot:NODE_676_length_1230_cov_303.901778_g487_i0.p1 GENE.NODE_676_length_1230_cov_303.901778_g487_i0~~NODE_676_length_1230_cov_303.901778_g487_i0.p1  ORF type:complete len:374 (+),score=118.69 NODE_676_length_1230_cov_303.901778_g487_i0:61-1122(+)